MELVSDFSAPLAPISSYFSEANNNPIFSHPLHCGILLMLSLVREKKIHRGNIMSESVQSVTSFKEFIGLVPAWLGGGMEPFTVTPGKLWERGAGDRSLLSMFLSQPEKQLCPEVSLNVKSEFSRY